MDQNQGDNISNNKLHLNLYYLKYSKCGYLHLKLYVQTFYMDVNKLFSNVLNKFLPK